MTAVSRDTLQALIARLSRRETGRLIGALGRTLGASALSLAEDCVQDAFVAALDTWGERGVPDNPFAWLLTTARNRALDRLRRHAMMSALEPRVSAWIEHLQRAPSADGLGDEELSLMVLCCDPALEQEARLALTLKAVCGFTVEKLARAFLATPEAIAAPGAREGAAARTQYRVRHAERPGREHAHALRAAHDLSSAQRGLCGERRRPVDPRRGLRRSAAPFDDDRMAPDRVVAGSARVGGPDFVSARPATRARGGRRHADRPGGPGPAAVGPGADRARVPASAGLAERCYADAHASRSRDRLGACGGTVVGRDGLVEPCRLLRRVERDCAVAGRHDQPSGRDFDDARRRSGLAALETLAGKKAMERYLPYHMTMGDLALRSGRRQAARQAFSRALALPMSTQERRLVEPKLRGVTDA